MSCLRISNEDEITLPSWLAGCKSLSLAEIGAIVTFACLEHAEEDLEWRLTSDEFAKIAPILQAKGILIVSVENSIVKMDLDLDAARDSAPPREPA